MSLNFTQNLSMSTSYGPRSAQLQYSQLYPRCAAPHKPVSQLGKFSIFHTFSCCPARRVQPAVPATLYSRRAVPPQLAPTMEKSHHSYWSKVLPRYLGVVVTDLSPMLVWPNPKLHWVSQPISWVQTDLNKNITLPRTAVSCPGPAEYSYEGPALMRHKAILVLFHMFTFLFMETNNTWRCRGH